MSRKRLPPDDPREWLNRASANLARAKSIVPEGYLEDCCFDAQQGAEKAIKAVFVCRGEKFPYVHDLDKLLGMLERNGVRIPKYVPQADDLSKFTAVTRYPGQFDPVKQRTYRRADRIATAVVLWAERQVEQQPFPA